MALPNVYSRNSREMSDWDEAAEYVGSPALRQTAQVSHRLNSSATCTGKPARAQKLHSKLSHCFFCGCRGNAVVKQTPCLGVPFLLDETMGIKVVLRAELDVASPISIDCIKSLCRCHGQMLRVSCGVTDKLVGTASETCDFWCWVDNFVPIALIGMRVHSLLVSCGAELSREEVNVLSLLDAGRYRKMHGTGSRNWANYDACNRNCPHAGSGIPMSSQSCVCVCLQL